MYTYNVRCLGDDAKRRQVFHYLHTKKVGLAFLQETHSIKDKAKLWKSEWGGQIWYDHGDSKSKGVAVLVSKDTNLTT